MTSPADSDPSPPNGPLWPSGTRRPRGKRRRHHDTAQQLELTFSNSDDTQIQVRVRVFDDGVGYRYSLPGSGEVTVTSEASAFRFPAATEAYAAEFRSNYENLYERAGVREVEVVPYMFPALPPPARSVGAVERVWCGRAICGVASGTHAASG